MVIFTFFALVFCLATSSIADEEKISTLLKQIRGQNYAQELKPKLNNFFMSTAENNRVSTDWVEIPIAGCEQPHGCSFEIKEQFIYFNPLDKTFRLTRIYDGKCFAKASCVQPEQKSEGLVWFWRDFTLKKVNDNTVKIEFKPYSEIGETKPGLYTETNPVAIKGRGYARLRDVIKDFNNKTIKFLKSNESVLN